MKENSERFRLAYSSQLLEGNLCKELGLSGKNSLIEDILKNKSILDSYPDVKEVMKLFSSSRDRKIDMKIIVE